MHEIRPKMIDLCFSNQFCRVTSTRTVTYVCIFHRKLKVNIILSVFSGLKLKTAGIMGSGGSCHMGKMFRVTKIFSKEIKLHKCLFSLAVVLFVGLKHIEHHLP